jgi:hypothetical protein
MPSTPLPQHSEWSLSLTSGRTSYTLCAIAVVSSALLQKIALPGSGGALPVTLLIYMGLAAWGFAAGALNLNVPALISYAIFSVVCLMSAAVSDSPISSALSLPYLLVVHIPLLFTVTSSEFAYKDLLRLLSFLSCASAVIGVLQYGGQFIVGPDLAFFLDTHLPESLLLQGYNRMNPLYWGTTLLKSNGLFFLEPSFFCQFLAIGVIAELLLGSRLLRLFLMGSGLVVSYSGTGLTMLALVLPFFLIRRENLKLVLFGSPPACFSFSLPTSFRWTPSAGGSANSPTIARAAPRAFSPYFGC